MAAFARATGGNFNVCPKLCHVPVRAGSGRCAHSQGLHSATVLEFTDADTLFIVDSLAGMVLAGLATAFGAGLFPIVFGGAAETLPHELATMPTRLAHGIIATMLVALTEIWVTAMVGGLADVGYLLFVDLPGYVNFFPGTVMTLISASAIVLSFWVWLPHRNTANAPS